MLRAFSAVTLRQDSRAQSSSDVTPLHPSSTPRSNTGVHAVNGGGVKHTKSPQSPQQHRDPAAAQPRPHQAALPAQFTLRRTTSLRRPSAHKRLTNALASARQLYRTQSSELLVQTRQRSRRKLRRTLTRGRLFQQRSALLSSTGSRTRLARLKTAQSGADVASDTLARHALWSLSGALDDAGDGDVHSSSGTPRIPTVPESTECEPPASSGAHTAPLHPLPPPSALELRREYQAALAFPDNARRPGLWLRCAELYISAGDFRGALTILDRLSVRLFFRSVVVVRTTCAPHDACGCSLPPLRCAAVRGRLSASCVCVGVVQLEFPAFEKSAVVLMQSAACHRHLGHFAAAISILKCV